MHFLRGPLPDPNRKLALKKVWPHLFNETYNLDVFCSIEKIPAINIGAYFMMINTLFPPKKRIMSFVSYYFAPVVII
jgi:hypothetical protein